MFLKSKYKTPGKDYTIPQIDLSQKPDKLPDELDYLFENTVVDDSKAYLGAFARRADFDLLPRRARQGKNAFQNQQ